MGNVCVMRLGGLLTPFPQVRLTLRVNTGYIGCLVLLTLLTGQLVYWAVGDAHSNPPGNLYSQFKL